MQKFSSKLIKIYTKRCRIWKGKRHKEPAIIIKQEKLNPESRPKNKKRRKLLFLKQKENNS